MSNRDEQRQQLIRDVLAPEPGVDKAAADHALWPWKRLAAHLTPLIGEAGFCALYGRTAHLASRQFTWITVPTSRQSIDALLGTLKQDLQSVDAITAGQANISLLDTYAGLLAALIGEALITRILTAAWIDGSDRKNTQEKSR